MEFQNARVAHSLKDRTLLQNVLICSEVVAGHTVCLTPQKISACVCVRERERETETETETE